MEILRAERRRNRQIGVISFKEGITMDNRLANGSESVPNNLLLMWSNIVLRYSPQVFISAAWIIFVNTLACYPRFLLCRTQYIVNAYLRSYRIFTGYGGLLRKRGWLDRLQTLNHCAESKSFGYSCFPVFDKVVYMPIGYFTSGIIVPAFFLLQSKLLNIVFLPPK